MLGIGVELMPEPPFVDHQIVVLDEPSVVLDPGHESQRQVLGQRQVEDALQVAVEIVGLSRVLDRARADLHLAGELVELRAVGNEADGARLRARASTASPAGRAAPRRGRRHTSASGKIPASRRNRSRRNSTVCPGVSVVVCPPPGLSVRRPRKVRLLVWPRAPGPSSTVVRPATTRVSSLSVSAPAFSIVAATHRSDVVRHVEDRLGAALSGHHDFLEPLR